MFMKTSTSLICFSNYPKNSKYYNNLNNLVIDKMRDETCGVPIKGFVALKSKMYTFTTEKKFHKSKKVKSIPKTVVNEELK